jgi:hypothetical protein
MKSRQIASISFAILVLIHSPNLCDAQDEERTFPSLQMRYRLPNKDWTWEEPMTPDTAFMAMNQQGIIVLVSTIPLQKTVQLDQDFVNGYEKSFFKAGQMTKRGGRFITFQGRPCYQAEGTLMDGRTVVSRCVLSPSLGYSFMVMGGHDPIEITPEFEAIANGWTLTAPAVQDAVEEPRNISYLMGRVVGFCIMGIAVAWVVGKVFKKSPTRA